MAQRNETVYPTKLPAKRKLVLAPWQLAINAALESLFGHEINSELASIIRGWISRWSSTRRVERRGKKKKKRFNDASFCMLFFRPLQQATNEQAHVSVKLGWSITPTTKLESRLLPALEASFEDFWRPRLSDFFEKNYSSQFNIFPCCLVSFHNFEVVSTGSTL